MTTQIAREETCCHHISYSFQLAARVLLYAPSHRQESKDIPEFAVSVNIGFEKFKSI